MDNIGDFSSRHNALHEAIQIYPVRRFKKEAINRGLMGGYVAEREKANPFARNIILFIGRFLGLKGDPALLRQPGQEVVGAVFGQLETGRDLVGVRRFRLLDELKDLLFDLRRPLLEQAAHFRGGESG